MVFLAMKILWLWSCCCTLQFSGLSSSPTDAMSNGSFDLTPIGQTAAVSQRERLVLQKKKRRRKFRAYYVVVTKRLWNGSTFYATGVVALELVMEVTGSS